jgi:hypothetical protein
MLAKNPKTLPKSTFDEHLREAARTLSAHPLPEDSEERLLARLASEANTKSVANPQRRRYLSYGAATLATAALSVAFLTNSRLFVGIGFAAAMESAIRETTTWHLSGWRQKNGQKVKWEVWGRRSPFLYWERVGEEILVDDGKRRLHLLPPDTTNGRSKGLALYLPTETVGKAAAPVQKSKDNAQKPNDYETFPEVRAQHLVGIGGDRRNLSIRDRDERSVTLGGHIDYYGQTRIRETTTLSVDAKTHLPREYRVQRQNIGPSASMPTTEAELKAAYNIALPATISEAKIVPPKGWAVLDLTAPNSESVARSETATRNGLTVRAVVNKQDAHGNLHITLHPLMDGKPFRQKEIPLAVQCGEYIAQVVAKDELGNTYIAMSSPPRYADNADTPELWLTPVTPFDPNTARPQNLQITIPVKLERYDNALRGAICLRGPPAANANGFGLEQLPRCQIHRCSPHPNAGNRTDTGTLSQRSYDETAHGDIPGRATLPIHLPGDIGAYAPNDLLVASSLGGSKAHGQSYRCG